jgi:hypothetical protein
MAGQLKAADSHLTVDVLAGLACGNWHRHDHAFLESVQICPEAQPVDLTGINPNGRK